jgi:two-component system LytT family response regulator
MIQFPKLRVFITDDEAPARNKLMRFLADEPDVSLAGEAGNGLDAVRLIRETRPDLLFLDIQMPGMDGFEVIQALGADVPPRIVFVTAHDEYAIQAFEVHAFGYLLKPFDQPRFRKVLAAARNRSSADAGLNEKSGLQELLRQFERHLKIQSAPQPKLLVEENDRGILLSLNTVDWVEADRNYLYLHVGDRRYQIRGTIESLEEKLDRDRFLRLNRSSIVRIDFIREFQKWTHGEYRVQLASGKILTWTRRYLDHHPELLRKL